MMPDHVREGYVRQGTAFRVGLRLPVHELGRDGNTSPTPIGRLVHSEPRWSDKLSAYEVQLVDERGVLEEWRIQFTHGV